MTTLTVRTSAQDPAPPVRDCPPVAPPGFFRDRTWRWRSGPCAALGHRFEVWSDSHADIARCIRAVTQPLTTGDGAVPNRYRVVHRLNPTVPFALYHNETRLMMASAMEPLIAFLCWHINRHAIATAVESHVVLHAAGARRADVTVLLPGGEEHGKTTTVAGLLREGYDYVTDEAFAVDPDDLTVKPFPKALSLDPGSWYLFPECRPPWSSARARQWQVPPEHLNGRAAPVEAVRPPKVIVFPKYTAGSTTRLHPMSRAEAVRALALCTFEFHRHPRRNLDTLAELAAPAIAARMEIGSLEQAVLMIERLVSQVLLEEYAS